jgi:hypothetical protein
MRALFALCLLLPFATLADDAPAEPYQPMAFLAGHCWKGSFPNKPMTDEHCFEWVYDGRFLRDRHTVHAEGKPDYLGETMYYWDPVSRQIQFIYFESQGGVSKGSVQGASDGLLFPPASYVDADGEQTYRSHWQRSGGDAYEAVNEFKTKDGWVVAWKIKMQKQP